MRHYILSLLTAVLILTGLCGSGALAGGEPAAPRQWNGSGPFATGLGNRVMTALAVSPDRKSVYAGSGSGTLFSYVILPPTLTTTVATGITATSAILNGTVNANNAETIISFAYGLTDSYGSLAIAAPSPLSGTVDTPVSATLAGLACNSTYHFRVAGEVDAVVTYGNDMAFITSACPTYKVSYDGNNPSSGTAPDDTNNYLAGANVTVAPKGGLLKNGHPFNGWNTTVSGSGTQYAAAATFTMPALDTTLYAQWLAIPIAATPAKTYNSFTASWGSVPGASGYLLDVATDSTFTSLLPGYSNKDVGNVTSYPVSGLAPNTAYSYRVRAYNAEGSSASSNSIDLTTGRILVVTCAADSGAGSLRQAIIEAVSGEAITFAGDYTISLLSQLTLGKDLLIDGTGHLVTISGENLVRVFDINPAIVATLSHLNIVNGKASDNGGGILNFGRLTLQSCTLAGNFATNVGGGIFSLGPLTIVNSTLFGNSAAAGPGGGIYNGGPLTVQNCTLADNQSSSEGHALFNVGSLALSNTLISSSYPGSDCIDNGPLIPKDNNLITDGSCSAALTSDPKLGSLAVNGGSTLTMALLSGSPAIGAGNPATCLAVDQRGMPRPQDSVCDIGAYERGTPTGVSVAGGTPQSAEINEPFATALTIKVTDSLGGVLDGISAAFAGTGIVAGGSSKTNSSGIATFTPTANATVGSYVVTATVDALSADFNLTNSKHHQEIIFDAAPSVVVDGSGDVSAGADSGLTVLYTSLTPTVCTISGTTVSGVIVGPCIIAANQAGNTSYASAPQVSQEIIIGKGRQNITFGTAPRVVVNGVVSADASSGLIVTFTSLTPTCSVNGSTVTRIGDGLCTIAANQAGDDNYEVAPQVTQGFIIDTSDPLLTISSLDDGDITNSSDFTAAGTVSDSGNGVRSVTVNGDAAPVLADGSFSRLLTLEEGENVIVTIVTDNADNQTRDSRTISYDSKAPLLTVTAPADLSATASEQVTITGDCGDAVKVTVKVNAAAVQLADITTIPGSYRLTVTLGEGQNTLEVTATDVVTNVSSASRTITYDPTNPTVAITIPVADLTVHSMPCTISGIVADAVTDVALTMTVNGEAVIPEINDAGGFTYELEVLQGGKYQIVVTAKDQAEHSSIATRNVTYAPYGDVNGDGYTTAADALLALQMAIGTITADLKADVAPLVNGLPEPDGKVSAADALVILRKAVGLW